MRVALVHDCLHEYGDAERTLQVLHRLYPEAPVYTAFVDDRRLGKNRDRFSNWDISPGRSSTAQDTIDALSD